ncbi:MAG: glutathione S-transferase [Gaiellales bacterium]|jgi:glutathione S-transferase|nr:glutathione S-transferase [Gaiellales bacterium]
MSITLYHADSCPYCVRTRLVLDGKGVEWESVDVDLRNKPPWLREMNPRNRVPVIRHGDLVLTESEALDEYIEELYPDPPMMPPDPAGRAWVRILMRRFEDVSDPYYAVRRGEPGAGEELAAQLSWLQELLSATPYIAGPTYTLADPGYWPWIARLPRMGVSLDDFPAVSAWCSLLEQRPEYAAELSLLA